jgi:hypothetical protein
MIIDLWDSFVEWLFPPVFVRAVRCAECHTGYPKLVDSVRRHDPGRRPSGYTPWNCPVCGSGSGSIGVGRKTRRGWEWRPERTPVPR